MPQHTRRPPAPPAPEFYISDPPGEAALGSRPSAPGQAPREARSSRAPSADSREPRAERREPNAAWHQSEPWAVVMLVSFAMMLAAVYVPGTVKLVLIGLSLATALAGIVMLLRRGVFDHPPTDE